jgi:exosortase/archaeosortase family protein
VAVVSTPTPAQGRFAARVAVAAVISAAIVLVLLERVYRVFEVQISGLILSVITSSGVEVVSERETVYFGLSGASPLGLKMTPECSSVFLLLPLFLVTAALLWFRPENIRRLLLSLAVSAVVVIAVNQLRVLAIVGLVNWLGVDKGYYWGHTLLGSMVSVFGGAIALVVFVWLSTRKPKPVA